MIYTYKELLSKYGSQRKIKQKVLDNTYFSISRGIYSNEYNAINEQYIKKRFPEAILTGQFAFYFHNLTDYIPKTFEIATLRNATRVKCKDISQSFQEKKIFSIGKTNINGVTIYDLERMIIELFRFKSKYPTDYFMEIVHNLRNQSDKIDLFKIKEYLKAFKRGYKFYKQIYEVIF
ncbi:MAG: hypothetical protein MJ213_00885 [Bacilli bacterium]|nr:hypothetical protein [Bacilli bacterium]